MSGLEIIGRYALYDQVASGGMATVHIGRLLGAVGFSRTVAIKRMHRKYAADHGLVTMFIDEARLAARVRHPNVVPTLDVIATGGELLLVMEHVQGATLSALLRMAKARGTRVPVPIVAAILSGVLHGLHAAHEARDEQGKPLNIVHRDVSPQNIMVGVDGVSRVLDFGIAKAAQRLQRTTQSGTLKGKLAYMAPEQVMQGTITRSCDNYAAAVVLWEALTGRRRFQGKEDTLLAEILEGTVEPPSAHRPEVSPALDTVVLRGLEREPVKRFATAREMASALEAAVPVAIAPMVGAWLEDLAAESLVEQASLIARIERASSGTDGPPPSAEYPPLHASETQRLHRPVEMTPDSAALEVRSAALVATLSVPIGGDSSRSRSVRRVGLVALLAIVSLLAGVLLVAHFLSSGEAGAASAAGPPPSPTVLSREAPSVESASPTVSPGEVTLGSTAPVVVPPPRDPPPSPPPPSLPLPSPPDRPPPVSRFPAQPPTPAPVSRTSAQPPRPAPKPAPAAYDPLEHP